MEEGVFIESINYASLKKLPILFACEDNGLAIHTHKAARTPDNSYEIEYLHMELIQVLSLINHQKIFWKGLQLLLMK